MIKITETIGYLIIGFVFFIVYTKGKTKRKVFKSICFFSKLIINFNKNLYKLIKNIFLYIRNINEHLFWIIKFNNFKNPKQVKNKINDMNGREFEFYCANLFRENGYKVKLTKSTNDYGRDIILRNKDGEKIYVECKRWKHNNGYMVGREICEKLIGSCTAFNVNKAIVINTGDYHPNACVNANRIKKIGKYDLQLWNIENLINLYKQNIKNK